jgi:hypothetical protein
MLRSTFLPLVDRERTIRTRAVGMGDEFLVEPQKFRFEVEEQASYSGLEAFATGRSVGGPQEILE